MQQPVNNTWRNNGGTVGDSVYRGIRAEAI
jgi:hypothetical protein